MKALSWTHRSKNLRIHHTGKVKGTNTRRCPSRMQYTAVATRGSHRTFQRAAADRKVNQYLILLQASPSVGPRHKLVIATALYKVRLTKTSWDKSRAAALEKWPHLPAQRVHTSVHTLSPALKIKCKSGGGRGRWGKNGHICVDRSKSNYGRWTHNKFKNNYY